MTTTRIGSVSDEISMTILPPLRRSIASEQISVSVSRRASAVSSPARAIVPHLPRTVER